MDTTRFSFALDIPTDLSYLLQQYSGDYKVHHKQLFKNTLQFLTLPLKHYSYVGLIKEKDDKIVLDTILLGSTFNHNKIKLIEEEYLSNKEFRFYHKYYICYNYVLKYVFLVYYNHNEWIKQPIYHLRINQ